MPYKEELKGKKDLTHLATQGIQWISIRISSTSHHSIAAELIQWVEKQEKKEEEEKWVDCLCNCRVAGRNWPSLAQAVGIIKGEETLYFSISHLHLISQSLNMYVLYICCSAWKEKTKKRKSQIGVQQEKRWHCVVLCSMMAHALVK